MLPTITILLLLLLFIILRKIHLINISKTVTSNNIGNIPITEKKNEFFLINLIKPIQLLCHYNLNVIYLICAVKNVYFTSLLIMFSFWTFQ